VKSVRDRRREELFHELADRPADERRAVLAAACADDPALRAEVEALLDADGHGSSSLDVAAWVALRAAHSAITPAETVVAGQRIDRYEIVRLIASGGMGNVYEAVQDRPRRTVAVKLLRTAFSSAAERRRFEFEAELLAHLRHPSIVQVFDAGVYERGLISLPYFVTELVPGARRLSDYVVAESPSLERRIELFLRVCDAVQHGHVKGVVHRDLKPDNVLVDESGQPRLIDYGVARVLDRNISTTMSQTSIGAVVGTMQYMSPEQLRGDTAGIDTRTDVYALGLILYELLAGRRPYDLSGKTLPQAVQAIETGAPTGLGMLDRRLRGAPELIVAKAMAKDRARRYQSVTDLAQDIRRWQVGEPVSVRPAGSLYHLRALARRNRPLVVAASVGLFGILLGSTAAVWQMMEAATERNRAVLAARRAEQINVFLQRVLSVADPAIAGPNVTVRAAIDQAAGEIESLRAADPVVFADVSAMIGRIYHRLGESELAQRHLGAALALRTEIYGERSAERAHTLCDLGFTVGCESVEAQLPYFEEALSIFRAVYGEDHPATAVAWGYVGSCRFYEGRLAEAEELLRRSLATLERLKAGDSLNAAYALKHFAMTLQQQGRVREAEPLLRRSVEVHRQLLGDEHYEVAIALRNLAAFLNETGRAEEAAGALERAAGIESKYSKP
jgi:tetratricopeptide (TPR) repeat protein/tRNA A-37 threonylcarbamoyl transferase component Bud32